jgi:RNA polymerase sigma factor (sigma-70 family)
VDAERAALEHGRLVDREVARYRTWHVDRADLRQAGLLGLLIAASRFDPGRGVPFAAYAVTWVRKEIQRAFARQEFPAVLPPGVVGRTVALRRALAEHADQLHLAAAALGISRATVTALRGQLDPASEVPEDELTAPGYVLSDPEATVVAADFVTGVRAALARMAPRQADALVLRYGLDGGPELSLREVGRRLGVSDHTARALVERAQAELRPLVSPPAGR